MFKNMRRLMSNFRDFVFLNINSFINQKNKMESFENDKIMIPTIRNAFECLKYHFIISSFIVFLCYLLFSNKKELMKIFPPFFLTECLSIIIFKKLNVWIEKILSEKKVLMATYIYALLNIVLSICLILNFKFNKQYDQNDQIIMMCITFGWIIHSLNLIPGKIFAKLVCYIISIFVIALIIQPKWSYGMHVFVANFVSYIPQIYILWKKYHNECKVLNSVEYERNINNFLYNQFPEIILTLNSNYEILKVNQKASIQHNIANLKNFKDYALNLVRDENISLFTDLLNKENLENIQYTINSGKINEERIIASSSSFEFDYSKIIIVILRNVTHIYKVQERNISERYQNILLFSAPHEVRSQLNIISGNIERLEKKFEPEILKIAKYGSKVLEYKLNLIFDFVHIVTKKFANHIKKYCFKDFVHELFDIIEYFSSAKNIKLIRKFKSTCDIIKFDYERIMAIVIHVGLNSIKHTKEGSILINVQYKLEKLSIQIKDTGIGMDENKLKSVQKYCNNDPLDMYDLMQNALVGLEQNNLLSGLGLLAASLITKKLGGGIIVNSLKNQGTCVSINLVCKKGIQSTHEVFDESCNYDLLNELEEKSSLKFKINAKISDNVTSLKLQTEMPTQRSLTIIVVDDQKFNRITLVEMLKSLKKSGIYEAENGIEAIEMANKCLRELNDIFIFMDIDMPILNGIEATRLIKKNDLNNKIKIVMLSAFNTEEIIKESIEAGAIDFYVKPISFKKLKELESMQLL